MQKVGLQRARPLWRWVRRVALALCLLFLLGAGLLVHRAYDFGDAISTAAPFSTSLSTTTRNTVVILGYGGPDHDGPYLTDSILLISQNPQDGSTALISVPRDLWVQVPANSGNYAKINTVFSYGVSNGGRDVGGELAAQKVATVLGIPVPYWVSIDFTGFDKLIDQIGGVDINVPDDFSASLSPTYAPAVMFHSGQQHMDGATALLFARARYCQPAQEASDFARSARQQLLVRAIAARMRSPLAWGDLTGVMNALQPQVATNLSVRDLVAINLAANYATAKHIALTNQNVLDDSVSADGQDILVPHDGDWNPIQQYVQQQLAGS